MARLKALDGLRGACLVLMVVTHLHFDHSFLLGYLHFRELGFADTAQAFIFLSGLLVGLVGVKERARAGAARVRGRFHRRALQLYGCHLAIVMVILLGSRLLPWAWFAWNDWLTHLFDDGPGYALATILLVFQPTLMDILPQYVLYMLAAPLLVRLVADGRATLLLGASLLLWLSVQLGVFLPLWAAVEGGLRELNGGLVARSAFNPLGWQLLFVGGVVLGGLGARGALTAGHLRTAVGRQLAWLSVAVLVYAFGWRMALDLGLVPDDTLGALSVQGRRQALGIVYVVNFAALGYLVAWLIAAAPSAASAPLRRCGAALAAVAHDRWLAMLGRNALAVFSYHVILVYGLKYLDAYFGPLPDPWFSLLAVVGIASLTCPAWLAERRRTPRPVAVTPAG